MNLTPDLEIVYLDPHELTPYEGNARKHGDVDLQGIKDSIETDGFNDPIGIWGDENLIVEGHGRQLAAIALGMEKVPCIRLDHLTDAQRRDYAIRHNRTAELSEWDEAKKQIELEALAMEGFDVGELFEPQGEQEQAEIKEDEAPEPPQEPKAKRGQIYQLGRHRLMCGDATDAGDVKELMNGAMADMVFTDPPYNVAIGSKNAFLNTVQKAGQCCSDIEGDKGMNDEEIGQTLWEPAFRNLLNNAKDDCSIYVTMPQGGTHMMMMMMMMMAGWQVKHELMWHKNSPTFSMGRLDYDYQHEPIMYGWNKTHTFYGKGEQNKSVWEFDKPRKCDIHPTMKPVELIANAILNSSKSADIVVDVFGGSGSTLMACEQTNRVCYMMEIDPKYVDVIIDRWETFAGETAVLIDG